MSGSDDTHECANDANNAAKEERVTGDGGGCLSAVELRNTAYVVLVIGAIFLVNAMETGSYRTPWPVAIIVSLVGLGLFGYSFILRKNEEL